MWLSITKLWYINFERNLKRIKHENENKRNLRRLFIINGIFTSFLIKNYYESLNYGNYSENKRSNRKILSKTSENPYDLWPN